MCQPQDIMAECAKEAAVLNTDDPAPGKPIINRRNTASSRELRIATRVFLAILLAHSDEFGVVTGLGKGDIRDMTRMSVDRVESQIQQLKRLNLILDYIPGGTSPVLFGKYTGIYYLDMNHCYLKATQQLPRLILLGVSPYTGSYFDVILLKEAYKKSTELQVNRKAKEIVLKYIANNVEVSFSIKREHWACLSLLESFTDSMYLQFIIDKFCGLVLCGNYPQVIPEKNYRLVDISYTKLDMETKEQFDKLLFDITECIKPTGVRAKIKGRSSKKYCDTLYQCFALILAQLIYLKAMNTLTIIENQAKPLELNIEEKPITPENYTIQLTNYRIQSLIQSIAIFEKGNAGLKKSIVNFSPEIIQTPDGAYLSFGQEHNGR